MPTLFGEMGYIQYKENKGNSYKQTLLPIVVKFRNYITQLVGRVHGEMERALGLMSGWSGSETESSHL